MKLGDLLAYLFGRGRLLRSRPMSSEKIEAELARQEAQYIDPRTGTVGHAHDPWCEELRRHEHPHHYQPDNEQDGQ